MLKKIINLITNYKDFLTFLCSIIAIGISFFNLTLNFKDADLDIFIGEKITFSINDNFLQIVLPIIFTNNGSKPGVIYYSSIKFENINSPNETYILTFDKIMDTSDAPKSELEAVDVDKPLVINKYSSEFYSLNYSLGKDNLNIIPPPGSYKLTINAWTTPLSSKNPEITKSIYYNLSEVNYDFLLENRFMTAFPEDHPLKIPGILPSK